MNNKISNPKTEVPKGKALNDKDYLDSALSLLKNMEKNYTMEEILKVFYEQVFTKANTGLEQKEEEWKKTCEDNRKYKSNCYYSRKMGCHYKKSWIKNFS